MFVHCYDLFTIKSDQISGKYGNYSTMQIRYRLPFNFLFSAIVFFTFFLSGACSPRLDTRGNLPNKDLLANIEIGHVHKNQVLKLIGSPSTTELFDGESWYYISEQTSTKAFFEPKIISRKIVIIRFDGKGIVKKIETVGLDAGRKIVMVDRKTPTAGEEMTILKQLFGNIGRFEGGPKSSNPAIPGN